MRRLFAALMLIVTLLTNSTNATRGASAGTCAALQKVTALGTDSKGSVLAGTVASGLYRSPDGSACWQKITTFPLVRDPYIKHMEVEIGTIVSLPGKNEVLLVGASGRVTNDMSSLVLYRSIDDGATWTNGLRGFPHTPITPNQIARTKNGTLVMAFQCSNEQSNIPSKLLCKQGLARSTDSGASWRMVGPKITNGLAITALANGRLVASLGDISPEGPITPGDLWQSNDEGLTWQKTDAGSTLARCDVTMLVAIPWLAAATLAGCGAGSGVAHVYRSIDGGSRWLQVFHPASTQQSADTQVLAFASVNRSHTLLFADQGYIYRSTDNGIVWRRVTILPTPERIVTLLSTTSGSMLAGTLGGVYRSIDDGKTWQPAGQH